MQSVVLLYDPQNNLVGIFESTDAVRKHLVKHLQFQYIKMASGLFAPSGLVFAVCEKCEDHYIKEPKSWNSGMATAWFDSVKIWHTVSVTPKA